MFGETVDDKAQVRRAAIALKSFVEKNEKNKQELIETSDMISIQFSLRKIPDKGSHKPYIINIPHSLRSDTDALEMCLFVKDGDKQRIKDQLKVTPIDGLTKVLSLKKLKTHFSRFDDKRKLCASYDLFLADDRILPSLPKALGKTFFTKKKQPVPVRLSASNKKMIYQLKNARDTTTMFISTGPCIYVKIAHTMMEIPEIVENILKGIEECVDRIPRKWKNIQSIHLKTHDSVALPIYNALPELSFKIDSLSENLHASIQKVQELEQVDINKELIESNHKIETHSKMEETSSDGNSDIENEQEQPLKTMEQIQTPKKIKDQKNKENGSKSTKKTPQQNKKKISNEKPTLSTPVSTKKKQGSMNSTAKKRKMNTSSTRKKVKTVKSN